MNTSSAKDLRCMFYHCEKLESIDLSSFDTTSVTLMSWMFFHCYLIKKIIIPETFNTSNVESMYSMFSHCKSLISLNLSSFDTTKVTEMSYMFNTCINLKYLDISHFSPVNITTIVAMFNNMQSLIYLNIYSFEINNKTNTTQSFNSLPNNLKICTNENIMKNYLLSLHKNIDCSDICFRKNNKFDIINNECINSCNDNGYNHECNNICYNECPEETYPIINNISNKDNISVEYDDGVIICLDRNPEGYYLDEDGFYEKCYESCKLCYGPGNETNNNCIKCKPKFFFYNKKIFNTNCYEKCKYYYYFNESNDYICTENNNCSGNYNKLILEKLKCIDNCKNDDIFKYEYNNICYERCPNGTIYSEEDGLCLEKKIVETTFLEGESENVLNIETSINDIYLSSYINIKNDSYYNIKQTIFESSIKNLFFSEEKFSYFQIDNISDIINNVFEFNYKINIYKNDIINESFYENLKEELLNNYIKVENGKDLEVEAKNLLLCYL